MAFNFKDIAKNTEDNEKSTYEKMEDESTAEKKDPSTKLNYQINQTEMAKDNARAAQTAIDKQRVATTAMASPQPTNAQATIPSTSQGFGRTT